MALPGDWPHWLRDLDANLVVTPQFVIHGNIRDLHLVQPQGQAQPQPHTTVEALWAGLLARGYQFLLHHSPVTGLQVFPASAEAAARAALNGLKVTVGGQVTWSELAEVAQRVARIGPGAMLEPGTAALVIDYQSQQRPVGDPPSKELHDFLLTVLALIHQAVPVTVYNPLVWLLDSPSDLPAWLVGGSDGIRQISIPAPDLDTRKKAAMLWAAGLPGAPARTDQDRYETLATAFAESTDGLTVRSMSVIGRLARDAGLDATRIEDAARAYRLGLIENKWKKPELRGRIVDAEKTLQALVLGQPRAVAHVCDVLMRSTMGLSGAWQGPRSTGPRGVLFFAGPTGVGKTELAKAVNELVFGDRDSYVRFDMSEFASEHAEARLIGAPPGFVGHGRGGELTDAVRRRPMSVILFDEIEKAHTGILDKFLQVLSDGRLTDGSGATVYFTDAVVIFTSNLGVRGVDPGLAGYEEQVRQSVQRSFRDDLNRPELLGRIGDNIVVFRPLERQTGRLLARKYVANVQQRVQAEHGIALEIPEPVVSALAEDCTKDMSLGGRGVGQELDSRLVNPLGRALALFTGSTATITEIRHCDGRFQVVLR